MTLNRKHLRCLVFVVLTAFFSCDNQTKLLSNHQTQQDSAAHCYAPSARAAHFLPKTSENIQSGSNDTSHTGMVWIEGGTFEMGAPDAKGMPNEYPRHSVTIDGFWMDATEVTNAQFGEFVKATGYITTAQKPVDWEELKQQLPPGTPKLPDNELQPGSMVFTPTSGQVPMDDISQWWKWMPGANWRQPEGPGTNIKGRENMPVVQISWEDAMAYCKWAGKRLPTEAEWEWAASSGGKNLYAWGNEEKFNTAANTWQGTFPYNNISEDGFKGIAPVKSYAASAFGLYDMSGNVWEWCADWYDETYYAQAVGKASSNPAGPATKEGAFLKVIRGGSYLCNPSYCEGYRRSRRMYSSYDSGTNHIGFRCVKK